MKKILCGSFFIGVLLAILLLPSCTSDEACRHATILASVVPADCDHEGYTLHSCQDCEMKYKTDIQPSKGHTLTEKTVAPTCTEDGYTLYSCACGYSYRGGFVPPTDHTFVSEVYQPTCVKQGYTEYTCECGYTYKAKYVAPTGHTLKKTVREPTCTTEGYTEYACACGYSYTTDHVRPKDHTFAVAVTAPSCTTGGFTTYSCTCGFSYASDYIAPKGHSLTKKITDPTCTAEGYTTYSCSACNYFYVSDYVKPKGHSFTTTVTYPTSSAVGYTVFDCSCGYKYTGDYVFSSEIFKGAYVDGVEILAHGIDVSKWNGEIDWAEIKNAGIEFVIIKAGSTNGVDSNFDTNYANAKEAGLDVGCYFYSYATTVEGISKDADDFLKMIAGKNFEYPVYLDFEDPSQESLGSELLTEMCKTFIEKMQRNKYFCGLYVNNDWLLNKLDTQKITTYFDVWIARWLYSGEANWPESFGTRTGMWQYTDSGVIGTHTGYFDLNVAFKDYPTLIKSLSYNGFEKTE